MSRLLADFEAQLKNLNKGISFMDKEAILFHEIDLQLRIYTLFVIVGLMMITLGMLI
jgi:hypothetical protein